MHSDPRADPSLTLDTVHPIDDVCTNFEAKWRKGELPPIEDVLFNCAASEQSILLRELLAIELEYRLLGGGRPVCAEYLERFPNLREVIELTFRESKETASPSTGQSNLGPLLPLE